jgi:hypothetical protein
MTRVTSLLPAEVSTGTVHWRHDVHRERDATRRECIFNTDEEREPRMTQTMMNYSDTTQINESKSGSNQ